MREAIAYAFLALIAPTSIRVRTSVEVQLQSFGPKEHFAWETRHGHVFLAIVLALGTWAEAACADVDIAAHAKMARRLSLFSFLHLWERIAGNLPFAYTLTAASPPASVVAAEPLAAEFGRRFVGDDGVTLGGGMKCAAPWRGRTGRGSRTEWRSRYCAGLWLMVRKHVVHGSKRL